MPAQQAPLNDAQTGPVSAADGARRDWQPWGTGSAFHGAGGADGSSGLGGLSRLMSMSISGGGSSVRVATSPAPPDLVVGEADKIAPAPPTHAAPAPPPTAGPLPPGPGASVPPTVVPTPAPPAGGPVPTPSSGGPDPTGPFHEHDTPPPAPFAPPPAGPLDPTEPSGTLPTGGSPSPNPEPGSILLLGTGLIAVLGELRRRRVL